MKAVLVAVFVAVMADIVRTQTSKYYSFKYVARINLVASVLGFSKFVGGKLKFTIRMAIK